MTQTDIVIAEARAVMDGFMVAFNAQDAEALRTTWFHFPHVRLHSGQVTVMATPADFRSAVWGRTGQAEGWARTAWDYVEPVDSGPDKVHFRVQFTRYRADGSAATAVLGGRCDFDDLDAHDSSAGSGVLPSASHARYCRSRLLRS